MCLIIFSPDIKKSKIDPDDIARAFKINDDGAGMAYIKNGNVITDKVYFKFKSFKKAYKKVTSEISGPLLIHFRLSTSGLLNRENAHPFTVDKNKLVVAHNGIFSELSEEKSKTSDTVKFVGLMKSLNWCFPYNKAQQKVLEMICGGYNKLVFLDNKEKYLIINEEAGTWKHNTWYSNEHSFKQEKTQKKTGQYKTISGDDDEMIDADALAILNAEYGDIDLNRYARSVPWMNPRVSKLLAARTSVKTHDREFDPDFHGYGYGD
jgi:predicted glutamine amidotransferase